MKGGRECRKEKVKKRGGKEVRSEGKKKKQHIIILSFVICTANFRTLVSIST
jgi:hypothetical protein